MDRKRYRGYNNAVPTIQKTQSAEMLYRQNTMTSRVQPGYRSTRSLATVQPARQPARSVAKKPHSQRRLTIFLACLLLSFVGFEWIHTHQKAHAAQLRSQDTVTQAQLAEPTAAQQQTYTAAVQQIMASNPDVNISVVSQNLATGKKLQLGTTAPFTAASTAKLLTAVTYFWLVEQGKAGLQDQLEDGHSALYNLQQMITLSDNDAWQALNDDITHPVLEQHASDLGLSHYDPADNTMTANDISLILQKLYDKTILSNSDRQLLLGYMQKANYRDDIVAAVPAGYTVYHKIGFTDNNLHDAAIITKGAQAMSLVIYTNSDSPINYDSRNALFHQITTAALAAYF